MHNIKPSLESKSRLYQNTYNIKERGCNPKILGLFDSYEIKALEALTDESMVAGEWRLPIDLNHMQIL